MKFYNDAIHQAANKDDTESISGLFKDSSNLTQIAIPPNIQIIGDDCFYGCVSLIQVSIPSSVIEIGLYAFYNCSSLIKISLPSSVKQIKSNAFFICSSLVKISLPSSITSIGSNSFNNCRSLTEIAIPFPVKSINNYTFYCCSSLTKVSLPLSVESIDNRAFSYCVSLEHISIPHSIKSIDENAFDGSNVEEFKDKPLIEVCIPFAWSLSIIITILNMLDIGEIIITFLWWRKLHPWFIHGYKTGKKVYQLLIVYWTFSSLFFVGFMIYWCFFTRVILKKRMALYFKKKNILFHSLSITILIIIYLIAVINGIIVSKYALRNDIIDEKSYKCLKYIYEGCQGAENWVSSQSLKKQNEYKNWYSNMINKAFDENGEVTDYYCGFFGNLTLVSAVCPILLTIVGELMLYAAFYSCKYCCKLL